MTGCSSSTDGKKSDFTWFKVEVPEGVQVSNSLGDTVDKASFQFEHGAYFKPVWYKDNTATDLYDEEKNRKGDDWIEGGKVTFGNNTYMKGSYEHGKDSKADYYFMDGEGGAIKILVDYVDTYDEAAKTMLTTFELAGDVNEKIKEAKDITITDVTIK